MVPIKGFVFLAWISFGMGSVLYVVLATSYERTLIFKEPIPDRALSGHVIRTEQVPNEGSCRVKCYFEPYCLSINVGPGTDGQFACELNNYTDDSPSHSSLERKKHYNHYAVENFCHGDPCPNNVSVCQVGFTNKGYRCACHEGYIATEDHGQCEDIDECHYQSHLHSCEPGYECENVAGSFICYCPSGFVDEGNICKECQEALGMANGAISDGQISASSMHHGAGSAIRGRLNFTHATGVAGGWSAEKNDINQWLQVDLLRQDVTVTRVATQGRSDVDEWVTKYRLQHSNNGMDFRKFNERGQTMEKEFDGNTDRDTVKYQDLNPPVRARYIRFRPTAWKGSISMRVELYGCQACNEDLGMESGTISDEQISASSEKNVNHTTSQGRLHFQNLHDERGGWTARREDKTPWLQVDLRSPHITVARVATQGRSGDKYWVTKYKLQYSNDGIKFDNYTEKGQELDKEFPGNTDRLTVVYHYLNPPIRARYIRFRPTAWHDLASMRVELYGCNDTAVSSCQSLRSLSPPPPSGVYWIDPDDGSPANKFKAYCDMETDGGGWTLVWSYHFTRYHDFGNSQNAVTPSPNWPANPKVRVSTTPPLTETDYNAMKFGLWKQLGSEVLIKSNINNWLICRPLNGSLVGWQVGSVECDVIKSVGDNCFGVAAPSKFGLGLYGPVFYSTGQWYDSSYYYFEGHATVSYPVHDPCGAGQQNQLKNVGKPHGNIFVR